jgi:hypothetical protein
MKYLLYLLFILPVFIDACQSGITPNTNIVFPASNVSFQQQVYPFLKLTCSYEGCHSGSSPDISAITEYSTVINSEYLGLVIPYNPNSSRLYQTVNNPNVQHLPYVPMAINDNQKKGIYTWINEGAKNN